MSFDPMVFLEWIPQIALAGLALIIALVLWMLYRTVAPAAPGIPFGYYEILGKYAGGKLQKRIQGLMVDATPLFMNEEIEPKFKELLLQEIEVIVKKEGNNPNFDLKSFRDQTMEYSLSKSCHVIVTRERLFSKHVIIQYGYVEKRLDAYASHDPTSKFTLSIGPSSKGTISGKIRMLPDWEIYKLGKVKVSLFKPDVPQEEGEPQEKENELPDCLAKLALYAPATVELKELMKSKDDQLQNLRKENADVHEKNSAMSTEMDTMRTIISTFSTTKKVPESFVPKKFDVADFIALSVPTLVGYYVAEYSKFQPIVGIIFGLFIGAFLLYKRRV